MRPLIVLSLIFSMTVLPIPAGFAAGGSSSEQIQLQNVELSAAGKVSGRLVDAQGRPLAGQTLQIRTSEDTQKKTTSEDGSFTIESRTGGNCAIIVGDRAYACRLWSHNTAPPKSLTSFGIVHSNGPIVRAQDCGEGCDDGYGGRFGRLGGVSGGQLLGLGLLAGAVVAIVLAVDNDDDGS
ncbi:MAG: carboxypeptidase-like regulatory domain-containing protein [Fuerstiella sp.]